MTEVSDHEAKFHDHGERVDESYPQGSENPLRTGVGQITAENDDGTYVITEQVWADAIWSDGTAPGQYVDATVRDINESRDGSAGDFVLFWEQYDQDGVVELVLAVGGGTDRLVATNVDEAPGLLKDVLVGDTVWISMSESGGVQTDSHIGPQGGAHAWTHTVDPGGGKTYIKAYDDRGHFLGWWDSKGANWKGIDDPDGVELVEPTSTTALATPAP